MYGVAQIGLTIKKNIKSGYPIPKRPMVISPLPINGFKFKDIGGTASQRNGDSSFKLFFRQSKVHLVRTELQAYSLLKTTH